MGGFKIDDGIDNILKKLSTILSDPALLDQTMEGDIHKLHDNLFCIYCTVNMKDVLLE